MWPNVTTHLRWGLTGRRWSAGPRTCRSHRRRSPARTRWWQPRIIIINIIIIINCMKLVKIGYEDHLVWKEGAPNYSHAVSLSVIYWILLVAGDKRHITVLVWPELCLWRDRRIRNLARLAGVCRGRDKCYRYSASPLRHLHHTTPWPSLQRILILPGCKYCTLERLGSPNQSLALTVNWTFLWNYQGNGFILSHGNRL